MLVGTGRQTWRIPQRVLVIMMGSISELWVCLRDAAPKNKAEECLKMIPKIKFRSLEFANIHTCTYAHMHTDMSTHTSYT